MNAKNGYALLQDRFFLNSAATNNATLIKNIPGVINTVVCFNAGAAVAYVKLYNLRVVPNVGVDVPEVVIAVPAAGHAYITFGFNGYLTTNGLSLAIVTGAADTDNTAVAASQVKVAMTFG